MAESDPNLNIISKCVFEPGPTRWVPSGTGWVCTGVICKAAQFSTTQCGNIIISYKHYKHLLFGTAATDLPLFVGYSIKIKAKENKSEKTQGQARYYQEQ